MKFSPTTVAVCGTGSIGQRHLKNAAALGARVLAWSHREERVTELSGVLGIPVSADLDAVIDQADAVVIATPTDAHVAPALRAAQARKALLIEKPVAHSRAGVQELMHAAAGLVTEVGCQLRAHPALQELKARLDRIESGRILAFRGCVGQRLDQWRSGTDYRHSYSADSARGGGALFDLVHEVDLAHWLCGPLTGVFAHLSKVSDLETNAEDLANLLLAGRDGLCGSLQLDMVSPTYRRAFEIVCAEAVFEWTYAGGALTRIGPWGAEIAASAPSGFERNDLFMAQMRHFLKRIRNPDIQPLCSLEDGVACLDILLAARQSARTGRWQTLGGTP